MKLHRFIGEFDFSKRRQVICDRELVNQIKNVFRLKEGNEILLGDGKMNEALAKIVALQKDLLEAEITKITPNERELETHGILYCSVLKENNFELVVQKATEIGVKEIVPVLAKNTVKLNLNLEQLEKIIKEAAEQSGRGVLPVLHKPISFSEALKHSEGNDLNLFFRPSGMPLREVKRTVPRLGIFIGPEGGWIDEETEAAAKERDNFVMVSLGNLILRAETAAIAAAYSCLN
ncbi:MAG: RsmE family RNA methyltransferase [bacterium]|nr:RsmE family RNA methyltransferase [bacterium]